MENKRVYAIDVMRALTLVLMIFVNDIPGMKNIPAWLQHMPQGADALGLADIVFPLFLFVVGMAIPLAMEHRKKKGDDNQKIVVHILTRTFALIIIGMFRVNVPYLNSDITGIPQYLWALLAYLSIFVVWNVYPKSEKAPQRLFRFMKIAGIIGLIWLAFIFRSGSPGNEEFMQPRWWGILGLIGWCYLIGSLVYFWIGKHIFKISIVLVLFGVHHVAAMLWGFEYPLLSVMPGRGSLVVMVLAGVLATIIFNRYKHELKTFFMINGLAGLFFLILGFLIRPVWGISKLDNTPSWIYICLAIAFWGFAFVYWLVDLKGIRKWSIPIEPAGTSTLTAYLLSDVCYYFTWLWGWSYPEWLNTGYIGIIRSVIFVFFVLFAVKVLKRLGVHLKL